MCLQVSIFSTLFSISSDRNHQLFPLSFVAVISTHSTSSISTSSSSSFSLPFIHFIGFHRIRNQHQSHKESMVCGLVHWSYSIVQSNCDSASVTNFSIRKWLPFANWLLSTRFRCTGYIFNKSKQSLCHVILSV